jgi:hypothetical protein
MKGVSSNKVINNCFEKHIEMSKDRLDEAKMREVIGSLRRDLSMPSDSESRKKIFLLNFWLKSFVDFKIFINFFCSQKKTKNTSRQ